MREINKVLFVGDPHAVWDEIDDCNTLINQIKEICVNRDVDTVIWLGDLHHTHSIVRIEVMEWWNNVIGATLADFSHIVIVGNHDRPAEQTKSGHALLPLQYLPNTIVVDRPKAIQGVLFLPYISDAEVFVAECDSNITNSVVCHATFVGSKFSNGFIPEGGVDENRLPQSQVISGHIHVNQKFGKVFYPGSPRWRDAGEANENKSLFVATLKSGTFSDFEQIESRCRSIKSLQWNGDFQELISLDSVNCKLIVEIKGSRDYVSKTSEEIKKILPKTIIKPQYIEQSIYTVSETKGIHSALMEYMKAIPEDVSKEIIKRVYGN